jgi:DedD protein
MEKEQKKLLLVAVSVGVFLLVTITVAIIILTPKVNTEGTAFSSSYPVPSGRGQPSDNVNITPPAANNTRETNIYSESAADVRNETPYLIVEIPTTAGVPDNPEITPPPVSVVTTAPARPAASPAPAAAQTSTSTSTSRPAAARQTTPSRTTNDYWIQTGAYSAIVRAEDVKELLFSKGITSIIENRVVDGRNLYRVRIGPYTTEKEAGYWLELVKSIDGFSDSQIRQTARQQ